jgi:hypothetical protein
MHPAMVKVLAAEHVRDMLVRAERTQRVSEARHARKAFRARRPVSARPVSASPVSASPVSASPVSASPCQPVPTR